jgi:hypothetical protein
VTRRNRKRRRRVLPEALHIDAFASRIDLSLRPGPGEVPTVAQSWCDVGYSEFDGTCPLCLGSLPWTSSGRLGTAEHVPPYSVGGTVRTRTCPDCNARSSAAEADLVQWWAKEYPARFGTRDLPGSRVAGGVLLRDAADGKFALVISGRPEDGVHDVLTTGARSNQVTGTFVLPTGAWRVMLLRAAYLAACVHLGEVPVTADAEHARAMIRNGTFAPGAATVGLGERSVPLRVFRIYDANETQARRIWIGVAILPWTGGGVPIFGVGLGHVAFVTWPIPDTRYDAIARAKRDPSAA